MKIDYEGIKKLIAIVEQNDLAELVVEENGLSVCIKVGDEWTAHTAESQISAVIGPQQTVVSHQTEEPPSEALVRITSPMAGIFYKRPKPDSPPFVEVGDYVEPGQTIGLIEAMKVFSEVPCEVAGRVVEIPVENGKLVNPGDVLFVVDTSAAEASSDTHRSEGAY